MATNENYYTILTSYGKQALANAQASGTAINITEFAVGDGNGNYYAPNETQTGLVNEVYRAQINRITTDSNNPNWVIVEGIIPADVGGFTIREIGIFDDNGNLIAIGNYPETYKPVLSQGAGNDMYIRFIMEVENVDSVQLKIDPAIVLASRKYVDDEITAHNSDQTSHNIPGQISTAINNHNTDTSAHADIRDSVNFAKLNGINFKNLIINGDFTIWQRGTSFNTGNSQYCADRFLDWSASPVGITGKLIEKRVYSGTEFSGNIYHHEITQVDTSIADRITGVAQRVEITKDNYYLFDKKQYTVSCWVKTNKSIVQLYVTAKDNNQHLTLYRQNFNVNPGQWTKLEWTYLLDLTSAGIDTSTLEFVELFGIKVGNDGSTIQDTSVDVGDYIELAYVQVEEGDTATDFEYVPYDVTLLRCMRYYEKFIYPTNGESQLYSYLSHSYHRLPIFFRVPKRVTPSIKAEYIAGGQYGGDPVSITYPHDRIHRFYFVAANNNDLDGNGDKTFKIRSYEADAEL